MKLDYFDYYLPKGLIAQYPSKRRDASRMIVLNRAKETIEHRRFQDINAYLKKGDILIFNDSRVIPARIECKRETGGKAEIFLLKKIKNNFYEALARPASKLFPGKRLVGDDGKPLAEIVENRSVGKLVKFADVVNIERELKRIGQVPLPPYIKRRPEALDETRYQTVYAQKDGSTASPTAGLHFTKEILRNIKQRGVDLSYVTLHVNYGTFAPIKTENVEDHKMYREYFELPGDVIEKIRKAKSDKKRVIAVGTTVTRVLEANRDAILRDNAEGAGVTGWTDLFIYPGYKFKIVDALLTNFHFPKSTLLMLVSAFSSRELISKAYNEAIKEHYRFYSYGDCMLIL